METSTCNFIDLKPLDVFGCNNDNNPYIKIANIPGNYNAVRINVNTKTRELVCFEMNDIVYPLYHKEN